MGPAGTARILADVGDVARFADRSRFAQPVRILGPGRPMRATVWLRALRSGPRVT